MSGETTIQVQGRNSYSTTYVTIYGVSITDDWTKKPTGYNTPVSKNDWISRGGTKAYAMNFIDLLKITRSLTIKGYIIDDSDVTYSSPTYAVAYTGTTLATNRTRLRNLFKGGGTVSLHISENGTEDTETTTGLVTKLNISSKTDDETSNAPTRYEISITFQEGSDRL